MLVIALPTWINAQDTVAIEVLDFDLVQTTEEEYNYMTKGYKIQVESGLDMKKGYEFIDLGESSIYWNNRTIERKVTVKLLVRTATKEGCGFLLIMRRPDTQYTSYMCIPTLSASNELWDRAFKEKNNLTNEWRDVIMWTLMKVMGKYIGNFNN